MYGFSFFLVIEFLWHFCDLETFTFSKSITTIRIDFFDFLEVKGLCYIIVTDIAIMWFQLLFTDYIYQQFKITCTLVLHNERNCVKSVFNHKHPTFVSENWISANGNAFFNIQLYSYFILDGFNPWRKKQVLYSFLLNKKYLIFITKAGIKFSLTEIECLVVGIV